MLNWRFIPAWASYERETRHITVSQARGRLCVNQLFKPLLI
ncbi:hypothetical protein COXBURSA334_A0021 [Coxiella burnetii Q321]|nr:hypothetical protein COXBURSA334_A0021 [Coxiella burnetii Q321]